MAQKTVLITGTSTGIGAACAARQALTGWKVYAGVRKEEDGERLLAQVTGDVIPVIIDVTERDQIDATLSRIETEVGHLDGLVNNAGIGFGGPIELVSDEEWRRVFDVNFFGAVTLTREAMPLVDKAGGRFVHIGSIAGRIAGAGIGPYASTKHALEAFNWSLRDEIGRHTKMRSSLVEPGEIKTAIWEKLDDVVDDIDARLDGETRRRYQFMVDSNRAFAADGAERGAEPEKVAAAVEHALTARRPRARYLVGADAKSGATMARLLPDRLRESAMRANGRRLERKGRKLR